MFAEAEVAKLLAFAGEHVLSFTVGLIVGFLLTNRYKLVRRNGKE